ncbi:MAG: hypothetical protein U0599_22745 [Vicinamibacteria bacterium]
MSASAFRPRAAALALAALAVFAAACGKLENPTRPTPTPEPVSSTPTTTAPNPNPTPTPVLGAPGPKPSPTPSPDATEPSPSPSATPSTGTGEGASSCGDPLPPPVTRMQVNVHLRGSARWILDSTPLVGPDVEYCRKIGFTDSRSFCPVRPEGNPQRSACELYAIGRAKDTARPGPTWYRDGRFCTGKSSGCENNADNQYLLDVYLGGTYEACAQNGVCGEVDADP